MKSENFKLFECDEWMGNYVCMTLINYRMPHFEHTQVILYNYTSLKIMSATWAKGVNYIAFILIHTPSAYGESNCI